MQPVDQWIQDLLKLNDEEDKITEKQIKIVKAAIEVFSEKGFAAASTSEIAQKAGVAEGTIFRHYKTKKDLLLSIVAPTMTKLVAPYVIRDINKVLDVSYPRFEDFVRAMIENRREFLRKHLPILKILVQEIPFHPELKEQFMKNVATHVFERIKKSIEHYQKEGQILDLPVESVIRLIASNVVGLLVTRYLLLPEIAWDDERETEITIDFIMRGLGAKRNQEAP